MKITDLTDFLGFTDTRKSQEHEAEKKEFDRKNIGPKEIYMSWEGYPKPLSASLDPKFKKTFLIIGVVVAMLFLLLQEFFLLLLVASMFFVVQVISKSNAEDLKYEISSHGLSINGYMYYWDSLERFFFSKQFGSENLAIDVKEGLPSRLFVAFKEKDRKKLIENINKHIPYLEEEPTTFMDKAYTSFIDKFDLEKK